MVIINTKSILRRMSNYLNIMDNNKFKVNIIESEAGWGSKIDEVKEFDTYDLAVEFINTHNAENDKDVVPDLYWRAKKLNVFDKPEDYITILDLHTGYYKANDTVVQYDGKYILLEEVTNKPPK